MLLCHEKSLRGWTKGVWTRTRLGGRVLISDVYFLSKNKARIKMRSPTPRKPADTFMMVADPVT